MVSLLQEFLGEACHGSIVGRLLYANPLGEDIRKRIRAKARLMLRMPPAEEVRLPSSCRSL